MISPKTPEQLDEIRTAGAVMRRARSKLLERAASGKIGFKAMLHARHADVLGGIRVGRLVKAMPGWGPRRAQSLLAGLDIDPEKRWRALSQKQRDAITDVLT